MRTLEKLEIWLSNPGEPLPLKEILMRLFVALSIVACICGGCSYINKSFRLKDDNIVEEFAEDVVELKTGIKLDFTPLTSESP